MATQSSSWCCFPLPTSSSAAASTSSSDKGKGSLLKHKSSSSSRSIAKFRTKSSKPKPVATSHSLAPDSPQLLNFKPLKHRRMGSNTPQTKSGMAVLFVRHGETNSNAERRVQVPETPLSDRGLLQAEQLGERLANEKSLEVVKIITSDYLRAVQTADAVSQALDMPVVYERLLRERNFGDLRGKLNHDLQMNGIDVLGEYYHPPNGESWDMFRARMEQAWEVIMEESRALGEQYPHHDNASGAGAARRSKRFSKRSSKRSPEKPRKVLVVVTHGLMLREMLLKKLTRMPEHCTVNDVLYMSNTALTLVLPVLAASSEPTRTVSSSTSSATVEDGDGDGDGDGDKVKDKATPTSAPPPTIEYHALMLNDRKHLVKAKADPNGAVGI
jgi:broad specificity phosphatase PhoE